MDLHAPEDARNGPEPRSPLLIALAIYALTTALFFVTTAPERLHGHTPFNHFALLADAWLHGRLDLGLDHRVDRRARVEVLLDRR